MNQLPGSGLKQVFSGLVLSFFGDGSRVSASNVAAAVFLLRVASAGIVFLSQVIMARWMGGSEFGSYVYVWVWVLILGHISNFGLASAAQKFIPSYKAHGEESLLRGFLLSSRLIGIGLASLMALVGLFVITLTGGLMSGGLKPVFFLALFCLPMFVLTDIQDGIARSYNWTLLALGPTYLVRPISHLAALALAFAMGMPRTAQVAMGCALIVTWLTAILQAIQLHRRLKTVVSRGEKAYETNIWLKTAFPIVLVEGFFLFLTHCDVLVLEHFRSSTDVAIYWAAIKTLALVAFVYFAVAAASAHRFSALHAKGDHDGLRVLASQAARWTFYPSLAAVLLLALVGPFILSLFGPQFVAGYPVMLVLGMSLLIRASIGPVERLLSMLGHQMHCARIYGMALALNVTLAILLVPPLGLMGAALATFCTQIFETAMLTMTLRRVLGFSVFVFQRVRR